MNDPYITKTGQEQKESVKHKNRPSPKDLKTQIENSMNFSKNGTENMQTFDIGNENMERNFPYYHILQQAPIIRKKEMSTTKTRGSQQYVKDKGKRDYEQVYWNGKTFTKEYSKNVRGSRLNLSKTSYWSGGKTSGGDFIRPESKQYLNVHYQYIDKICDELAPIIAEEYGMKLRRKQDSGLIDEFAMQEDVSIESVLEAFDSFM